MEQKAILHIVSDLTLLGNTQFGVESTPDGDLGFRMWGGKDETGALTKWLAKGKPGSLTTLKLTGGTTTGASGILQHNAAGDIVGGIPGPSILPDHDQLDGVTGAGPQYNHLTDAQLADIHVPAGVSAPPLTISGQLITFNYDTTYFDLSGNNLTFKPAAVDHGVLTGLGDDDHAQYSLVTGARAFTGAVGGVDPTAATHLTTRQWVEAYVATQGGSVSWQAPVNSFVGTLPGSPSVGDRHVLTTDKKVYQWSGSAWEASDPPSDGWTLWSVADSGYYTYRNTAADWVNFTLPAVNISTNVNSFVNVELALDEMYRLETSLISNSFAEDFNFEIYEETGTWYAEVWPSLEAYAAGTTYAVGNTVYYSGRQYRSLQNSNTGNQPDISPAFWSDCCAYDGNLHAFLHGYPDLWTLDTTTGNGRMGRARIALNNGTLTAPVLNWISAKAKGDGSFELELQNTSNPEFNGVIVCGYTNAFDGTRTPSPTQRFTNVPYRESAMQGAIEILRQNVRNDGPSYGSGVDPSCEIVTSAGLDEVYFHNTPGFVYQLWLQMFPNNSTLGQSDLEVVWLNDPNTPLSIVPGNGNLSNINRYDGDPSTNMLTNLNRFRLAVFGIVESGTGVVSKIGVTSPRFGYSSNDDALNDVGNSTVTSVPPQYYYTAFRIADLVLSYSLTGGGTFTLLEVQDRRRLPVGVAGAGGGAGGAISTFSDAVFSIFNAADPTKQGYFNLAGLPTSTVAQLLASTGGTVGKIPKYKDSAILEDSGLSESGTVLSYVGSLQITSAAPKTTIIQGGYIDTEGLDTAPTAPGTGYGRIYHLEGIPYIRFETGDPINLAWGKFYLAAGCWEPLSTNSETETTPIERTAGGKYVATTIGFDFGSTDVWQFDIPIPKGWTSGEIKFRARFAMPDPPGLGNTVIWTLGAEFMADDFDIDGAAYDSQSVTYTIPDTDAPRRFITALSNTLTISGAPADSGDLTLTIKRGTDTEPDKAYLIGIEVYFI